MSDLQMLGRGENDSFGSVHPKAKRMEISLMGPGSW
jgi:hypothetical protein